VIKLNDDLIERLLYSFSGADREKYPEWLTGQQLLDEEDPYTIHDKGDGKQIMMHANPVSDCPLYDGGHYTELESLTNTSFAKNGFTVLFNSMSRVNHYMQDQCEDGYDYIKSDWYMAFEDRHDPNTLFIMTAFSLEPDVTITAANLDLKAIKYDTVEKKQALLLDLACEAIRSTLPTADITYMGDAIYKAIAIPGLELSTILEEIKADLPLSLTMLLSAYGYSQKKAPSLPEDISSIKWTLQGEMEGAFSIVMASGESDTFTLHDAFKKGSVYDTGIYGGNAKLFKEVYLYAQERASHEGIRSGEIVNTLSLDILPLLKVGDP